ncbi:YfhO family protein [Lysobacter sp. Hz 25]|uniref:YfhO family protein n=1 Tax=Lysobacter sp. Hz 25 TaxID=3383698 RepID=UPI0038D4C85D
MQQNEIAGLWRRRAMAAMPWLGLGVFFLLFYLLYFSPTLLQGRYLAPGDGEVYYLPFFDLPIGQIWNSSILSGYSVISDIQSQMLYPLRWLSPSFNALVVYAYVVSAMGMFGLALKLTGSRMGAMMAALVVSGSGFMVGHLGHLSIIHAAAWIPAMLWAVASLRHARSEWPVILGAVAVAMSVYGGHPQVSIIGLLLAGCYGLSEIGVVARRYGAKRCWGVFWRLSALFALGLMLAGPVLLPLAKASSDGVRTSWSILDFNTFSHTLGALRLLAFPNLYGAYPLGPFGSYTGPWNITELAIYAGILPWFLAATAFLAWRRDRSHWFWGAAVLLGILLCMGTDGPLGGFVYELPVLGKFRAQGRFGIVVIIALGVLSAYGMSALWRASWSRARMLRLLAVCIGLAVLAVSTVALDPDSPLNRRGEDGSALWMHPHGWAPLLLIVLSIVVMALLAWKRSRSMALLAMALVVVDLGSFGWLYEWRYPSATSTDQAMPRQVSKAIAEIARGQGRLLPLGAAKMGMEPLRPNINMRHGIDSVVGYGPLLPARYATYAGVDTTGGFPVDDPSAPIMDVLGVRWIAGTPQKAFPQPLGRGCGVSVAPNRLRVKVPAGLKIDTLRVVSHMNCSVGIGNGRTMAQLKLLDAQERVIGEALTIDAGEEIAEEAYDRDDVRSAIQHRRPTVAQSKPASLWFLGELQVDAEVAEQAPTRIEMSVADTGGALVTIDSVAAIERGTGRVQALAVDPEPSGGMLGPKRHVAGMTPFSERLKFRGLTWGVCKAAQASKDDVVAALMSGAYGGQNLAFDPFATVLLADGEAVPALSCTAPPHVEVIKRRHGAWKLRVKGNGNLLAVVSERYHRDWTARVDGRKVPVLAANGLIMAVLVPAGEHVVELKYRPVSYRIGLGAAACALLVCLVLLLWGASRRTAARRSKSNLSSNK